MATQIGSNLATPLNVETIVDKKKEKQTDKLIKGIEKLEKRLTQDAKDAKAANGKFSWKGGIKGAMGAAKESLSDKFSLKGVAGMMGIKPDGMIGSMLEARHESKKAEKAAEQEKKLAIIKEKNAIKGTSAGVGPDGKPLSEKELAKKGLANYERKKAAEANIEKQEAEEAKKDERHKELSTLIKGGATLTAEEQAEHEGITAEKKAKRDERFNRKTKPTVESPTEEISTKTLAEQIEAKGDVSARAIEEMEKKSGPMSEDAKGGMKEGILGGIEEELLKLSKEQLEQLKKLVDNSTESEEDRLEKKAASVNPLTGEPKKEDKDKKKDSMFGDIKDLLEGFTNLGGALGKIGPILSSLSTIMVPLLIAMAPLLAMKAVTDWLAPAANGGNTESQTEALKSIHKAVGFNPSKTPSSESSIDTGDVEGGMFDFLPNSAKEARKKKIAASFGRGDTYNDKEVADIKKAYDIDVPEANKKKTTSVLPASSVSKPETPAVEASANKLEQTTKTNEDLTAQKEMADRAPAPSATVINNNTSNNSTTTTRVSPPVRPLDSTINNSMQSRFA